METTPIATNDATHRGVTDFYPEAEKRLKQLLASGDSFDTGWFTCKHEIRSARVARFGDQVLLNVTASMDDGSDLIDTLIWSASGGNDFAGSGWEALDKAGFETDEEKNGFQDRILETLEQDDLIFDENSETFNRQLEGAVSFERVCEELGTLEDKCESALQYRYNTALQIVKEQIENHRAYERAL